MILAFYNQIFDLSMIKIFMIFIQPMFAVDHIHIQNYENFQR